MRNLTFIRMTALLLPILAGGCFTNQPGGGSSDELTTGGTTDTTDTGTLSDTDGETAGTGSSIEPGFMKITSAHIATGASNALETSIIFSVEESSAAISTYCSTGGDTGQTSEKLCACQYRWVEVNSSTNQRVERTATSDVIRLQSYSAICSTPDVYSSEIVLGTPIKVKVIGLSSGNQNLNMTEFIVNKGAEDADADFRDVEGNIFINIRRYSCYDKYSRGMNIRSHTRTTSDSNTGQSLDVVEATKFCVASNASQDGGEGCDDLEYSYSAQSYYYNLYLPNDFPGDIATTNARFECPLVYRPLSSNYEGNDTDEKEVWPQDTTFALSKYYTADFTVPVVAHSVLSLAGDPATAQQPQCVIGTTEQSLDQDDEGDEGGDADNTSRALKCLGFAKSPNSDGTCPYFYDQSGTLRHTFRLRKFVTTHPTRFEAGGSPEDAPRAVDQIFVLDMPVKSSDELKPYTMLGPKPCPWAYFDHKGTNYSSGSPIRDYFATNDTEWNGKNVDDIFFPNHDAVEPQSCSAAMPIIVYDDADTPINLYVGTSHSTNTADVRVSRTLTINMSKIYVRPVTPWAPHWTEDTTFRACAPSADPFRLPPLHFYRDTSVGGITDYQSQTAWCAEVYPTQTDGLTAIEPTLDPDTDSELPEFDAVCAGSPGCVKNFTSHTLKNMEPDGADELCDTCCGDGGPAGLTRTQVIGENGLRDLPDGYLNTGSDKGYALHPPASTSPDGGDYTTTCDRTVINPEGLFYGRFPLLAPAADVEEMLEADVESAASYHTGNNDSYRCTITWDLAGTRLGAKVPQEGCCRGPNGPLIDGNGGAHWEPTADPDLHCARPEDSN